MTIRMRQTLQNPIEESAAGWIFVTGWFIIAPGSRKNLQSFSLARLIWRIQKEGRQKAGVFDDFQNRWFDNIPPSW